MRVSVIGCGNVRCVTGACFADLGYEVILVDIDPTKVRTNNAGQAPIYEPGLDDLVRKNLDKMSATTNPHATIESTEISFVAAGAPSLEDGAIDDVVEVDILAAESEARGEVFSVGGGRRISINDPIAAIEAAVGKTVIIEHAVEQKGDVRDTGADTRKTEELLGWHAETGIAEGLIRYVDWTLKEQ